MRWRTVGRVAATVLVGLVVPGAAGAVGIAGATGEIYTARDPSAPPAPVNAAAAPVHDPGKPTAVVVLGSKGANAADVLAPYEVLADTGAFNLYTAAPQRQPVPLTGNLDLIPDLTFGQLDDRLPTTPDVIVVPQLPDATGPSAAPIVQWLQRQRAQGDPLGGQNTAVPHHQPAALRPSLALDPHPAPDPACCRRHHRRPEHPAPAPPTQRTHPRRPGSDRGVDRAAEVTGRRGS
jgi:hypothetical protein